MTDDTINWEEVAAAQRRGKFGTMRFEDHELCKHAWGADPERYGEQGDHINEQITQEVRAGFPCKGGG